jgi:hypothetical protein
LRGTIRFSASQLAARFGGLPDPAYHPEPPLF